MCKFWTLYPGQRIKSKYHWFRNSEIWWSHTVVSRLVVSPRSKKVQLLVRPKAFLLRVCTFRLNRDFSAPRTECECCVSPVKILINQVCMFSICAHGFSPGTPLFSHNPETCMFQSFGDLSEIAPRCEWMVCVCILWLDSQVTFATLLNT